MECTLKAFEMRLKAPWLLGVESGCILKTLNDTYKKVSALENGSIVLIAEEDPVQFWGGFLGTIAAGKAVALLAPQSALKAWEEALHQLRPALILGNVPCEQPPFKLSPLHAGKTLIPTGGSGGRLQWAMHGWESLKAAVEGLEARLGGPLSGIAPLPLYHVSGLMPGLRALITNGTICYPSSKAFEMGEDWEEITGALLSLVPTQLERLLKKQTAIEALKKARLIFLGGAAVDDALLEAARAAHLPIALTYGMTETAAMVTLSDPEPFLTGDTSLGHALAHARLWIKAEGDSPLPASGEGRLLIEGPSLFQGYFPNKPELQLNYLTGDIGVIDENGLLIRVRRADRIIISGGEKIDPAFIEDILLKTGFFKEVHIIGIPNAEWGMSLCVCGVPMRQEGPDVQTLKDLLKQSLSHPYIPKHWIFLDVLPRKENGKIDVQVLKNACIES